MILVSLISRKPVSIYLFIIGKNRFVTPSIYYQPPQIMKLCRFSNPTKLLGPPAYWAHESTHVLTYYTHCSWILYG